MALQVAALVQAMLGLYVDCKESWTEATAVLIHFWARLSEVAAGEEKTFHLNDADSQLQDSANGFASADEGAEAPEATPPGNEQYSAVRSNDIVAAIRAVIQVTAVDEDVPEPSCSHSAEYSEVHNFFTIARTSGTPVLFYSIAAAATCPGKCSAAQRSAGEQTGAAPDAHQY
jgi:hypothetical protein